MRNLDNGPRIWIIVLWTLLNIWKIPTLRIYSPRMLLTTKVVMQTLETPPKSSMHRNSTINKSIEKSQTLVVKWKACGPSTSTTQLEKDKPLTTRSKVKIFLRKLCIVCPTTKARSLTWVEFRETEIHILKVSEKLVDKSFLWNELHNKFRRCCSEQNHLPWCLLGKS